MLIRMIHCLDTLWYYFINYKIRRSVMSSETVVSVDFVVELGHAAYSQKALPRKSPRFTVGFISFIRFDVVYIIISGWNDEAWSPGNTSKAVTHTSIQQPQINHHACLLT